MTRETLLRGAAVVAITASIALAAACSDEDVVDTIPPPRPRHSMTDSGPLVGPSASTQTPTPSTTRTSTGTGT